MTAVRHPDFSASKRIAATDTEHTFTGASAAAASGSQLHIISGAGLFENNKPQ
jgi:hypothetical protein